MTNGHYDFDEIADCIYSSLKTAEERKILYDITAHCLKCKECKKLYESVYNVYELTFESEHVKGGLSKESFGDSMHREYDADSDWEAEM